MREHLLESPLIFPHFYSFGRPVSWLFLYGCHGSSSCEYRVILASVDFHLKTSNFVLLFLLSPEANRIMEMWLLTFSEREIILWKHLVVLTVATLRRLPPSQLGPRSMAVYAVSGRPLISAVTLSLVHRTEWRNWIWTEKIAVKKIHF